MRLLLVRKKRIVRFLCVVFVMKNQADGLLDIIKRMDTAISGIHANYELIVVDRVSHEVSVSTLKKLTSETGLLNLQIFFYVLSKAKANILMWVYFNCFGCIINSDDYPHVIRNADRLFQTNHIDTLTMRGENYEN